MAWSLLSWPARLYTCFLKGQYITWKNPQYKKKWIFINHNDTLSDIHIVQWCLYYPNCLRTMLSQHLSNFKWQIPICVLFIDKLARDPGWCQWLRMPFQFVFKQEPDRYLSFCSRSITVPNHQAADHCGSVETSFNVRETSSYYCC